MSFECLTATELSNLVSTFSEQEVLLLAQCYTKNQLIEKAEIVQASSTRLKLRLLLRQFTPDGGISVAAIRQLVADGSPISATSNQIIEIPLHLPVEHPCRLNGVVTLMVTKATIRLSKRKAAQASMPLLSKQKAAQATERKSTKVKHNHFNNGYWMYVVVALVVALAFLLVH